MKKFTTMVLVLTLILSTNMMVFADSPYQELEKLGATVEVIENRDEVKIEYKNTSCRFSLNHDFYIQIKLGTFMNPIRSRIDREITDTLTVEELAKSVGLELENKSIALAVKTVNTTEAKEVTKKTPVTEIDLTRMGNRYILKIYDYENERDLIENKIAKITSKVVYHMGVIDGFYLPEKDFPFEEGVIYNDRLAPTKVEQKDGYVQVTFGTKVIYDGYGNPSFE